MENLLFDISLLQMRKSVLRLMAGTTEIGG